MTMTINRELFPKKEEIFSWIEHLAQWGHRKTGTPESRKSAEYIAGKFKEFGLDDIRIETAPSMCMFVDEYSLSIDGREIECFYANGTNRRAEKGEFKYGDDGSADQFLYLGDGLEQDFEGMDVAGKVVVCSIRFKDSNPFETMKWNSKAELYDPDGKLNTPKKKKDIYSPNNWPGNYFQAMKGGAAGFVGILEDYMDDPYWYSEDYTDLGHEFGIEYMKMPALWISRSSGKALKAKFAAERTLTGKMKMSSRYEYKDALNISGRLAGLSDEYIVVHSHHDAAFSGAVQDASGISEMLALANYFAKLDQSERKKSMMFVATDTHYTDYQGHQAFIKARQAEGIDMILDLAIEHIGKEAVFDETGSLVETGEVEARLLYVTEESGLYDSVKEIFKKYHLDKTTFAPVPIGKGLDVEEYKFSQDEIISDAYYFNESGVPVVSMVCAEMYIFHPSDTPDRIPLDELEPVGMAYAEIALKAAEQL